MLSSGYGYFRLPPVASQRHPEHLLSPSLSGRPRGGQRSTVQPPQLTSLAGRPRSTRHSIALCLHICDRHLKVCRNAAMRSSQAAASRPGGRGASTSSFHLLKVRVEDHFRASCRPPEALIRTGRCPLRMNKLIFSDGCVMSACRDIALS